MSVLPTISIVTPSLNQADYLEETLRSVLDQGYPSLEYVVVDGGSTDGSIEILQRYADRLAWWVSEPDGGHADGIMKGFTHTCGEIMAWINSSDLYYPWTLETVARVFTDVPEAEWIMGVDSAWSRDGGPRDVSPQEWNLYDVLSGDYRWVQQESVFWRRSLWDRAGGMLAHDARYVCDLELWLRFFQLAPLYHVQTILAGFRHHEDRRGTEQGGAYTQEAERFVNRLRSAVSDRDRRRAVLVRATGGRAGRHPRRVLNRIGLLPWYTHQRIVYDYARERWSVQRT